MSNKKNEIVISKIRRKRLHKTESGFLKSFYLESLFVFAIILALFYELLLFRIKYYLLIGMIFTSMNIILVLLFIDQFIRNRQKDKIERKVKNNDYLILTAFFFLNINYAINMARMLGGYRVEMIDIVSFIVNCSIGIAFLTVALAKSFYFSMKSYYKRMESRNPLKKTFFSKLTFATVFLSLIALISVSAIAVFSGNISYLSKVHSGAVTVESTRSIWDAWDWLDSLFPIGMFIGLAILLGYFGYYGLANDWNYRGMAEDIRDFFYRIADLFRR